MGQVIEVRLVNPESAEVISDEFTLPDVKYKPKDQTPAHEQAIRLALGKQVTLKSIERTLGPEFSGSGANTAWQYNYRCIVTLPDDPTDRELLAVLFAQYREKSE